MVNNKYTVINLNILSLQLQFIGLIGINQYLLNEFKFYLQFFHSVVKLITINIITCIHIRYCTMGMLGIVFVCSLQAII